MKTATKVKNLIRGVQISAGLHMSLQDPTKFIIKAERCEGVVNGQHVHLTYFVDIRSLGFFLMAEFKELPTEQRHKLIENEIELQKRNLPKEGV